MEQVSKVELVGVGLNATDTLIALAQYPVRGSKLEYDSESIKLGGQVASTVVACQTWGLSTRYVGKLGNDEAARMHEREFARLGVDAKLIYAPDVASSRSLILVDGEGERTVLCRRDEGIILKPEELQREWVVQARALHVDGYDTAAATLAAQWAAEAGIPVIADLDELYPGIEQLLENIDYLIVSRDFPGRLMRQSDPQRALRQMQERYGCKLAATTLGIDGVLAWDGKEFHRREAYKVPVVDTTGAGDVFHAGFIFGLLQDWDLGRQLDFACAAAAINCTAEGARGCIQPVASIEALIAADLRYESTSDHPALEPSRA